MTEKESHTRGITDWWLVLACQDWQSADTSRQLHLGKRLSDRRKNSVSLSIVYGVDMHEDNNGLFLWKRCVVDDYCGREGLCGLGVC